MQDGNVVDVNDPVERQVLEPNDAALLTSMLQNVVTDGTGQRAALPDRPVAGKTGTTENHGDAWFVGYTPQLAVAVWVGYPNKLRPMLTEFEGDPVAGGTFPAPIWKEFATKALRTLNEPRSPSRCPSSARTRRTRSFIGKIIDARQRQLQRRAPGHVRRRFRA